MTDPKTDRSPDNQPTIASVRTDGGNRHRPVVILSDTMARRSRFFNQERQARISPSRPGVPKYFTTRPNRLTQPDYPPPQRGRATGEQAIDCAGWSARACRSTRIGSRPQRRIRELERGHRRDVDLCCGGDDPLEAQVHGCAGIVGQGHAIAEIAGGRGCGFHGHVTHRADHDELFNARAVAAVLAVGVEGCVGVVLEYDRFVDDGCDGLVGPHAGRARCEFGGRRPPALVIRMTGRSGRYSGASSG